MSGQLHGEEPFAEPVRRASACHCVTPRERRITTFRIGTPWLDELELEVFGGLPKGGARHRGSAGLRRIVLVDQVVLGEQGTMDRCEMVRFSPVRASELRPPLVNRGRGVNSSK